MTVRFEQRKLDVSQAVGRGLEAAGILLTGQAVRNITRNKNIDTGRLRQSISYKVRSGKFNAQDSSSADSVDRPTQDQTCNVGSNVVYAAKVEYGYDQNPAWKYRPYLRPALDQNRTRVKRVIEEALKASL